MIPLFKVLMTDEAAERADKVLLSGYIGQGSQVDAFEVRLREVLQSPEPILTVNSGTSALDLALRLAGVKRGDHVITTPQTCTATNSPIVTQGAIPVWADVDPVTGLIDPESVARLMSWRVKAIIAVDWAGVPCDYKALWNFKVPIIEDAAHAFQATISGRSLANVGGDFICWSFQAIKHLTTVDGGALFCPPEQVDRARLMRWYGLDRTKGDSFRCAQDIKEIGFKYHMHDVAAAIGLGNLDAAIDGVGRHRANAAFYSQALQNLQGVLVPELNHEASWWIYPILVADRPSFQAFMAARGVATSPVHARNDRHQAFRQVALTHFPLVGLDAYAEHQVSIPVGWWLSDKDRELIADSVIAWSKTR